MVIFTKKGHFAPVIMNHFSKWPYRRENGARRIAPIFPEQNKRLHPLALQLLWCNGKYTSLDLIIPHHHKI
jgi:hypothetical protein